MMTETLDDILQGDAELPLGDDLKGAVRGWLAALTHERGAAEYSAVLLDKTGGKSDFHRTR